MKTKISNPSSDSARRRIAFLFTFALFAFFARHIGAQVTNIYTSTNFFGGVNNRSVTIKLRSGGAGYNGAMIPQSSRTFQPTNGTFTCTLLPLAYLVDIDGVSQEFPLNETGLTNGTTINLYDAINATLAGVDTPPLGIIAAGTNINLTTNYLGGIPYVIVSDTNTGPGGSPLAITNANAGANTSIVTNGQSITISSAGSPLAITNLNPGDSYETFSTNLHSVTLNLNASTSATANSLVARDGGGNINVNSIHLTGGGIINTDGNVVTIPGSLSFDAGNITSDGSGDLSVKTISASTGLDLGTSGNVTSGISGTIISTAGNVYAAILTIAPNAPESSSDVGDQGQIAWDANFIYVCIAPNTWKRAALSTW